MTRWQLVRGLGGGIYIMVIGRVKSRPFLLAPLPPQAGDRLFNITVPPPGPPACS